MLGIQLTPYLCLRHYLISCFCPFFEHPSPHPNTHTSIFSTGDIWAVFTCALNILPVRCVLRWNSVLDHLEIYDSWLSLLPAEWESFSCQQNFAVTSHSWGLALCVVLRFGSSWKVEISRELGFWVFGVIQPKLSVRIWLRMLSEISRFLALLSGVGWGLEASCSGSFCFLIHGVLRSHLEVILSTALTFWMLGTE